MYRILQEEGIDLPRYAVLNRDPDHPEGGSDFLSAVNVSVWGCGGDGTLSTVQVWADVEVPIFTNLQYHPHILAFEASGIS